MKTTFVVFIIPFLPLAALDNGTATTTTGCYEGRVSLNETCTPTQYILIHSVESQEVSSCIGSSPGAEWSRGGPGVHFGWEWCNLKKERCTTGTLERPTFLRMNYTCVNELSSIRRNDMCSNVSEVIVTSIPVYLQSPGYPKYYKYNKETNCTCLISVSQSQNHSDLWLTVYDMFTLLPETLTLKWSNGIASKKLTTVADNNTTYILNQETRYISSALSLSFIPNYAGSGYFWIGLESRAPLGIEINCSASLRTTPSSPTIATTSLTSKNTTRTTMASTSAPTKKTNEMGTTKAAVAMAEGDLMIIYIVVPTVGITIIIIIVVTVTVKKGRKSNYTKSDDAVRFSGKDFGVESLYAKENFAFDMVDNEIYDSQGSLEKGSLSGSVTSTGVGVAFGTFKGEKNRQVSNEDLNDRGQETDVHRGMRALPKYVTFGGEDLLFGDGPAVPPGGNEVIYAQINKPKKNNNQEGDQTQGQTSILKHGPSNERQGQTSILKHGPSNERQDQVVSDALPAEHETVYSLANDFDDPNEYFEYDVGSRSNDAEDVDEDYAYAYVHRQGRGSSKRREPQQSLHIYEDEVSDADGIYDEAMAVQIELNSDEAEGPDGKTEYDKLDFGGQKHKAKLDNTVSVQRTEL